MGYTHYFTQHSSFLLKDEWPEIAAGALEAVRIAREELGVTVVFEADDLRAPQIDRDLIRFNGVGDDLGHETFMVMRKRDKDAGWFCKTNRKPYDIVVCALLAMLDSCYPQRCSVGSDGRIRDWRPGVELAKRAWPSKANQIEVPRAVREKDRYYMPVDSSRQYFVALGWDDALYIEQVTDRLRIKLPERWNSENGWSSKAYDDWVRRRPHTERKWGSFRGKEHDACARKRLNSFWKLADQAVWMDRDPSLGFDRTATAHVVPADLRPPSPDIPDAPGYEAYAKGFNAYLTDELAKNPYPVQEAENIEWRMGFGAARAGLKLKLPPEPVAVVEEEDA